MKKMKKIKFRSKALLTAIASAVIITAVPITQYAATDDISVSLNHSFNSLLTTVGVTNPHQDTFTAYMYNPKTLDSSISNYRTYYGVGETLRIKVTFTSSISTVENPNLVIKFGEYGSERIITNYILGSADTESSGDDYIIFEYTLQKGDNGGLQLLNLSGKAKNFDGYSIEMALPGNANIYENKISALTSENGVSYTYQTKTINMTSSTYILDGNNIRPMVESDIQLIKNVNVESGSSSTVSILSNTSIQILTEDCNYVCIPNAVDIAGNPVTIHFAIDGSSEIHPMLSVTTNGKNVQGADWCKAGDEITIVAWEDYEDSSLSVKFGYDGDYKSAKKIGGANGYVTWIYTVQSGDDGILTIKTSGSCSCGETLTTYELWCYRIYADTTAPVLDFQGIYLASGNACYSETESARDNTNVETLRNASDYYEASSNECLRKTGTIWASKDSKFRISIGVSDNNNLNGAESRCEKDENAPFTVVDCSPVGVTGDYSGNVSGNLVANREGLADFWITVADRAGNETTLYIKNYITLLCDTTGPNVTVTTDESTTNKDTIDFLINLDDPNIGNYLGSGVYRTIYNSSVNVSNGSIIKSSTTNNQLRITVMPENDGNVAVYVPEEVASDNLRNGNTESNITKIYVDRTAPVITDITGVPTEWKESATITVMAYDAGVGLHELAYRFGDNQSWTTNNSIIVNANTATSNGKLKIYVRDKVGNESSVTVNLDKVGAPELSDTTPPVITDIIGVPNDWVDSAIISIIASDSESGLVDAAYSFDGGANWSSSNSKEFTNGGKYEICVKDKAGNVSKTIIDLSKIGSQIKFDTLTSGTCIKDVKEIAGVNYIIVDSGTTAENLLKYVRSSLYNLTIKTADYKKEIEKSSAVSTGNIIMLETVNKKYIIVVKGDVCGDGKINLSDVVKLNKARLEKTTLTTAENLAADVCEDGKINLSDIIKLNKYRLGKINNL